MLRYPTLSRATMIVARKSSARLRYSAQSALLAQRAPWQRPAWRCLSSEANNNKESSKKDDPGSEIVLTPGEKVVEASRMTMWAGIAVFALCCAYYIAQELIPTKMSPNRIFDRSFELIRSNPEVTRRFGETLKAYGREHGGHREGRRNFIEHTEYTDQEDGSKRVRVRYNIEGQFGRAFCFAEVSNQMDSGEFVYILVQDRANGHVHTIVDNRAALTAQRLASGSKEAQSAMSQLLGNNNSGRSN